MIADVRIARAIYCALKDYGNARLARWTLRTARRRMRLARFGHATGSSHSFHV